MEENVNMLLRIVCAAVLVGVAGPGQAQQQALDELEGLRSILDQESAALDALRQYHLTQQELTDLNRIVTMYLDYAEDQAARHRPMHMADWIERLDAFLRFNERGILKHAGTVSAELARRTAADAFKQYNAKRRELDARQDSDFDRAVKRIAAKPEESDSARGPSRPPPSTPPRRRQ